MDDQPAPTAQSERIVSLDVLRGFALLGILTMNIGAFSMPGAAYFDPTAYGDLTGANLWVWQLTHVFGDMKFMAIFSMLFGAGIVLMTERSDSKGRSATGLHYRRMVWLILFGLLHAHLLWYGDVLYWYGMCGLVVFLFRRMSPRVLLLGGVLSLSVASLLMWVAGSYTELWPPGSLEFVVAELKPVPAAIEQEIAAYRGDWLRQMDKRIPSAFEMQTSTFLSWALWRASGLMLLGMALFKLGVFSAKRSRAFYVRLVVVALVIGIPIILLGVRYNNRIGWEAPAFFFLGSQFNYWASVPVSLGWVGLVMLAFRNARFTLLTHALAAVGQTAFSNYILQTAICTTIFYGHGFGLFGRLDRVEQAAVVVAVWTLQMVVSPIWLRHFRYGPLEWLWRSLTYLRVQPFRHRRPLAADAVI